MNVNHVCKNCETENSYDVNVSNFLDHFSQCKFESVVKLGELTIRIKPLTYRQVTDFNLENFSLQKQLFQVADLKNEEEKNKDGDYDEQE